ncbi:MAG: DUF72 domain-containing protein [Rhodothermus sp.]|nr:DUF72 domain-containing protein [Rhodothermus sp.]
MTPTTFEERLARIEAFDLRSVHPNLRLGTASDRYAGWIGQIYPEHYRRTIKARTRRLEGRTFEERMLPIASVRDYFKHFDVLELDFTFYRPLREADGRPTSSLFTLHQYATHAPASARFLLKAPQQFFAATLRRSRGDRVLYETNPHYLNAEACRHQFIKPARDVLGDRLLGVIFEQEYRRVDDSPDPEANIAALDAFFDALNGEVQAHLELRSSHLLTPAYFDWLDRRGLGFVFSHWTWLPPLRRQWRLCGERFTAADRNAVVRLLTPLQMTYAEAYVRAYPFDRPVPELAGTRQARDMVLDATALVFRAAMEGVTVNVIANNRAWGNAPDLARTIARRVLEEVRRRQML